MTRFRPSSPQRLVDDLADRLATSTAQGPALRVAIDGADAAEPLALAAAIVDPLRERGRPVTVVAAETFWRDASLRLEYGREDVDEYLEWLDVAALRREVLDPLGPGGTGVFTPSLRDPTTNRATRAPATTAQHGAIVIVAGALLLGRGLPFDVSIHLALSPGALQRRTDPAAHWTLEAIARYEQQANPQQTADIVVRLDDPARPAVRG